MPNFEVDSTESVWYIDKANFVLDEFILKLTPQSQYGIGKADGHSSRPTFWSWLHRVSMVYLSPEEREQKIILKLTPQSQYGIALYRLIGFASLFWSWLHRVSMV